MTRVELVHEFSNHGIRVVLCGMRTAVVLRTRAGSPRKACVSASEQRAIDRVFSQAAEETRRSGAAGPGGWVRATKKECASSRGHRVSKDVKAGPTDVGREATREEGVVEVKLEDEVGTVRETPVPELKEEISFQVFSVTGFH